MVNGPPAFGYGFTGGVHTVAVGLAGRKFVGLVVAEEAARSPVNWGDAAVFNGGRLAAPPALRPIMGLEPGAKFSVAHVSLPALHAAAIQYVVNSAGVLEPHYALNLFNREVAGPQAGRLSFTVAELVAFELVGHEVCLSLLACYQYQV